MTNAATQLNIIVNGEPQSVASGSTVIELLRQIHLEEGRVAIERNLEILPRALWSETRIQPNDRFEIVHFVGGG